MFKFVIILNLFIITSFWHKYTTNCEDELHKIRDEFAKKKCACSSVWVPWYGWSCQISIPAPKGAACWCKSSEILGWLTSCQGENIKCQEPGSRYCENPDTSYLSCLQGGGDCWRHYERKTTADQQGCECSYRKPNGFFRSGGCKITNEAPHNHACRCHYQGFFTCLGRVNLCVDPSTTSCKNPNDSLQSCKEGRGVEGGAGMGDCGGYKLHTSTSIPSP